MNIKLEQVALTYGRQDILSDISVNIQKGEKICIIGPSGCGKTSLLNIISGFIQPSKGIVISDSPRISYVFQEDRLLPWKTVRENIRIVNPHASETELTKILDLVGLDGCGDHLPSQLSGGMRQRTSIARGFFFESDLLLMDEPLKSLDFCLRLELVDSIIDLTRESGKTLVYVTHELDEALMLGDRIIIIGGTPATISKEIVIETAQEDRIVNSNEMSSIRNRIIMELRGHHRQGIDDVEFGKLRV